MQLHEQRDALKSAIDKADEEMTDLMRYLSSDKFQGDDKNFVNASEMLNRVLTIRTNLQFNADPS